MTAARGCIDEAARFLLRFGAVDRALSIHVPTSDGRCSGCGSSAVRWPCAVAASAARARVMLDSAVG